MIKSRKFLAGLALFVAATAFVFTNHTDFTGWADEDAEDTDEADKKTFEKEDATDDDEAENEGFDPDAD